MTTRACDPPARSAVRRTDALAALVVAVVVLGPVLLRRGYVLRGDMVFVPDQPWKGAWLGLDGRVPRFVPGDAFLAAAGWLLPGDLVQKGVLLLALVVGGCGVGALLVRYGALPRVAAIVLYLWNPWVLERLAIGQWPVVVGYLMLPWVARAAGREDRAALVVWLGVCAVFSPASGLVALAVALSMSLWGRVGPRAWRRVLLLAASGLAVNLPWILPSLLAASLRAPSGQFESFASRGESSLGVVASVLSFGGIWKTSVVPGERGSATIVALSLLLTLVAVAGTGIAVRADPRVRGLLPVGAAALLLALVTAVPAVAGSLDTWSRDLPALGILRDTQRYLGPFVLALLPGFAAATAWVLERARPGREALRAVAVLLAVAPVLCLPSMAWGLGGAWTPVAYPAEWYAVRAELPAERTVVLPWRGSYRGFAWNDRRAQLDPAVRFFPGDVLIDDRVLVGRQVLASEDPLLDDVRRALDSSRAGTALRRLGVRSVIVEKGNAAAVPALDGAVIRHDGPDLTLLDLGASRDPGPAGLSPARRDLVVGLDLAVLLGWLGAGVATLASLVRSRRR